MNHKTVFIRSIVYNDEYARRQYNSRLIQSVSSSSRKSPNIFVHEGERQSFIKLFRKNYDKPFDLIITDNTFCMLSFEHENGILYVRMNAIFLSASTHVKEAIIQYIINNDPIAQEIVDKYIKRSHSYIKKLDLPRTEAITDGKYFDLLVLFKFLNRKYFNNRVKNVTIMWGKASNKKCSTIRLGSYDFAQNVIRINKRLDHAAIPLYFIQYIIYHEMIHSVIESPRCGEVHTPEFKKLERKFKYYNEAIEWERNNLFNVK